LLGSALPRETSVLTRAGRPATCRHCAWWYVGSARVCGTKGKAPVSGALVLGSAWSRCGTCWGCWAACSSVRSPPHRFRMETFSRHANGVLEPPRSCLRSIHPSTRSPVDHACNAVYPSESASVQLPRGWISHPFECGMRGWGTQRLRIRLRSWRHDATTRDCTPPRPESTRWCAGVLHSPPFSPALPTCTRYISLLSLFARTRS
jgi:hypothetical protein